eukprot:c23728_g1_i1 orf=600-1406(+)
MNTGNLCLSVLVGLSKLKPLCKEAHVWTFCASFNNIGFFCRCIVCLGEYEDCEFIRILPLCGHAFHVNCIDAWLRQHATCPVCRVQLQSPPIRRRFPSYLLSATARSRFSPGAIPESLFEQPPFGLSSEASDSRSFSQLALLSNQEHGVHDCGAQAHAIQIDSKEDSEVMTQNSISNSELISPLDVCEGLASSTQRAALDNTSEDTTRPSPSMVQVQKQVRDPFCKLSDESMHACKARPSSGFPASICSSADDDLAGRSSYSALVSRS